MIPKKILEQYPSFKDISREDLEVMKAGERYLTITNEQNKKVSKRDFKKDYPYEYYWGLHRATFHYSTVREIF